MQTENLLTAYHESARVVFAYLSGYTCDSIELPEQGANTKTKLNAGSDVPIVQAVLSGKAMSMSPAQLPHGIEVAKKLMSIYCAGTCAEIFFENGAKIPAELEMNISGQDLVTIEKIQTFLKKSSADHADDFPSQTIISVFRKLKDTEVWKAIELLAAKVSEQENKALTRFYIEDTLLMAGMRIQKPAARSGYSVGLHEDDDEKPAAPEPKASAFEPLDSTPLDIMVTDFLKKIKSNWQQEELKAAINYLHGVYRKYGQ